MTASKKTTSATPENDYKKEVRRIKQFMRRAEKRGYIWVDSPIPKKPKKITEKTVARLQRITSETLYKKANFVVPETGEFISGRRGRTYEAKKKKQEKENKKKRNKKDKYKPEAPKPPTEPQPELPPVDIEPPATDYYFDEPVWEEVDETFPDEDGPHFTYEVLYFIREEIDRFSAPMYMKGSARDLKYYHANVLEHLLNSAIYNEGEDGVAYRLYRTGKDTVTGIISHILYDSDTEKVSYCLARFAEIVYGQALDPVQARHIADMAEGVQGYGETD